MMDLCNSMRALSVAKTARWNGPLLFGLLLASCNPRAPKAGATTEAATTAAATASLVAASTEAPSGQSPVPPYVARIIEKIPAHLKPSYDPNAPEGLEWIRVHGPMIGDDRWLVRGHESVAEADAYVTGVREVGKGNKALLGDQADSSNRLVLVPVSGEEPRRFRMRLGVVTLEGDARPQLFDELRRDLRPDRFWPKAGTEVDAPGVGVEIVDLGQDRLRAVVLLRNYTGLLIRDTERLVQSLPAVVGHAPDSDQAKRMKAQLEEVGAKVKLLL